MLKLGNKTKFNFKPGKEYIVKEVLDTDFKLSWQWKICDCPNCKTSIVREEEYTIIKVAILEAVDGNNVMLGYTKELMGDSPLTMRLPDNEFKSSHNMVGMITEISVYLKEKNHGQ